MTEQNETSAVSQDSKIVDLPHSLLRRIGLLELLKSAAVDACGIVGVVRIFGKTRGVLFDQRDYFFNLVVPKCQRGPS